MSKGDADVNDQVSLVEEDGVQFCSPKENHMVNRELCRGQFLIVQQ